MPGLIDAKGEYFEKREGSEFDITLDWSKLLGDDQINESTWELDAGIEEGTGGDSFTLQTTVIWLKGGVAGNEYEATNTIVTAGGRTFVRAARIKVVGLVPETPDFTEKELAALRKAYAQGALRVRYDNKEVEYRSLSEMERILSVMETAISGSTSRKRFSFASHSRG